MSRDILQLPIITAGISKAYLSMDSNEVRAVKDYICRTYTLIRRGELEEGARRRRLAAFSPEATAQESQPLTRKPLRRN